LCNGDEKYELTMAKLLSPLTLSKRILNKDPNSSGGSGMRIILPTHLGQVFCSLPLGGGLHRLQTFVFATAKNWQIHVMSSNGRGVERGGDTKNAGAKEGELD